MAAVRRSEKKPRQPSATGLIGSDSAISKPTLKHSLSRSSFNESGKPNTWRSRLRSRSAALCDSGKFSILTTVLTFYALFGDDFRLAATPKVTDSAFNAITIGCIFIFGLEVVAACLGKPEYFLGFFFFLDTISTVTLALDLTWVGEALYCATGEADSDVAKKSQDSRAVAKTGRTVRIIRLLRLVKLYKTYRTAMDLKKKKAAEKARRNIKRDSGGFEIEDEEKELLEDDGADELSETMQGNGVQESERPREQEQNKESKSSDDPETRIGKKLSDMTTRRVIILVLVMMFGMPQFSADSHGMNNLRTSVDLGLELVHERWRSWCPTGANATLAGAAWCLEGMGGSDGATPANAAESRWWYEQYFLSFLYTHHMSKAAWRLYWVGVNSELLRSKWPGKADAIAAYLGGVAQLDQSRYLAPFSIPIENWDTNFSNPSWAESLHPLPDDVKTKLTQPWMERCRQGTFIGVRLSGIKLELDNFQDCSVEEELRCTEVQWMAPMMRSDSESDTFDFTFAFDKRATTTLESGLSMLQTTFICFAVGLGSMFFSKDANELLLNPIQRMIAKMETIKDNPLEAMRLGATELTREQSENTKRKEELAKKGQIHRIFSTSSTKKKAKEPMETVILEKTIIKLGALLALGFGEAGANVIGHNMKGGSQVELNPTMPGQLINAIIAVCTIRNFAVATEVLAAEVTLFVNKIAEIVHACVDDYHGASNRSVGKYFMLVWRVSEVPLEKQTNVVDMAIMAFVRIIVGIKKSPFFEEYETHPSLLSRVPGFQVKVGVALHYGWTVESAIGSEIKIDAAYLSPNVKVAISMEAATTQFGVHMVMSHCVANLCSREMAKLCRLIDHVKIKGARQSLRLYTIDLDVEKLRADFRSGEDSVKSRFKVRQMREQRKMEKWADDYDVWEAFSKDGDVRLMRSTFSREFFQRFATGYRNYEAGQWLAARDMFYTCHYEPWHRCFNPAKFTSDMWPKDGPTVLLLTYMLDRNFRAPSDWKGHRDLTERTSDPL